MRSRKISRETYRKLIALLGVLELVAMGIGIQTGRWVVAISNGIAVFVCLIILWRTRITMPKDLKKAFSAPIPVAIQMVAHDTAELIWDKKLHFIITKKKKEKPEDVEE